MFLNVQTTVLAQNDCFSSNSANTFFISELEDADMNGFRRFVWTVPLFICATLAQAEVPMGIKGNVTVVNDENNPVPVSGEVSIANQPIQIRDADHPALNSFYVNLGATIIGGDTNAVSSSDFDIPVGSTAVLEYIAARCQTPVDKKIWLLRLTRRVLLESGSISPRMLLSLPLSFQGKPEFSSYEYYGSSQPVKVYIGECENCVSSSISLEIGRESADTLPSTCNLTLHGHFVTP
jgi:hypothetical protein